MIFGSSKRRTRFPLPLRERVPERSGREARAGEGIWTVVEKSKTPPSGSCSLSLRTSHLLPQGEKETRARFMLCLIIDSVAMESRVIAPGLLCGARSPVLPWPRGTVRGDGAPKGATIEADALRRRAPLRSGTHASRRSIAAFSRGASERLIHAHPGPRLRTGTNMPRPSSRAPCARTVVSVGRGPGPPGSPADEAGRAGAASRPARMRLMRTPSGGWDTGI